MFNKCGILCVLLGCNINENLRIRKLEKLKGFLKTMTMDHESMHNKLINLDRHKISFPHIDNSSCNDIENISIFVHKTKRRKRKRYKVGTCSLEMLSISTEKSFSKRYSLPDITTKNTKVRANPSDVLIKKAFPYDDKFDLEIARQSSISQLKYYRNNLIHTKLTVYRCQMSTKEESCCCSCNSDAMFEVMKSLYDCYKKKNCDHCKCILCGHLPREERELAEGRKSLADIGVTALSDAEKKDKLKKALHKWDGKSDAEKEKTLRDLTMSNIPLPEPKNQAERDLINKVRRDLGLPPEPAGAAERAKLRKAEQLGIGAVPLEGKTPEQKDKLLRSLADKGLPLPEGRTPSEKELINKIKGSAPTSEQKIGSERFRKAKTPEEKENVLKDLANRGIPLPEGRTQSEKALIAKVKVKLPKKVPSEKLRRAKAAGLITPLQGKTPEQKAKILKGLADMAIPFPEAKTPSERKLMAKTRVELGLPPEPTSPSLREKYNQAANDGLLVPLEGKTPEEKMKILSDLADRGIPLPEGRTPSEKALISNIRARPRLPSEKLRRAKAAGLMTPLTGKSPEEKAKILRGLADMGIPLPEGKTPSENKFIAKIQADLGLPPLPTTPAMRDKYNQAAKDGLLVPLEGKTPAEKLKILNDLAARGIPLPQGRTRSEKAMIANVNLARPDGKPLSPSERLRKAKDAGLMTPLKGKTPEEKERILRNLGMLGLPLPEGKTKSEKNLIMNIRADLGLPPEPRSPSMRDKYNKAANDGLLKPLEGKTPAEKLKILNDLAARGIPLPQGRTPSEKAMIANINLGLPGAQPLSPSERLRKAKDAGLITPLKGKSPEEKERILNNLGKLGLPLPEGKTKSEKDLIMKVRADLGLPPEPTNSEMRDKYNKAANDGLLVPLDVKTPAEKEKILNDLAARGIPLPEGRTPSEKALVAKARAKHRPLSMKARPSERLRRAKDAGLITPLKGKTPSQKENIVKGLAMHGLPLPEATTPSEKKIADKIRRELGLPPEPKTPSMKEKYKKASNDGLLVPLEGKTPAEKKKILMDLAARGIPLPEGRTPYEKSLINKIKAKTGLPSMKVPPSERLRRAKAAGLLTPLKGKTPEQKENILKGLASHGLPLPEGDTPSEKKMIDKVRKDLGLPPEPETASMKKKYKKAADQGLLVPLEGKSPAEREKILKGLADMGLPLPEGRTPSEKALIADVKQKARPPSGERLRHAQPALPLAERKKLDEKTAKGMKEPKGPSQECICDLLTAESERERISKMLAPGSILAAKLKDAKAAGLLTPLEGKTPEQKEKILKGLAKRGIPLPEAKTPSDKKILDKVREDLGLPPEPKTPQNKYNYAKAQAAGLITPLEGKSPAQKDKILRGLADMGLPLPEGRTPSETALINAIKKGVPPSKDESPDVTSEKIRKAKAAGLLTPLEGKTPEQKEKILTGLAKAGFPLPEGKTPSDKALIRKIKSDYKIPEDSAAEKMRKARAAGLITPLTGKTPVQKEKILRGLAAAGLPLPNGKTPSEKALIKKVKGDAGYVSPTPSERLKKAKAAGLLTPLAGKTLEQKIKALRALQAAGIPLPEGTTPSETEMIKQLAAVKSPSEKLKDARAAGVLTPLQGKTPEQKEKIMRGLAKAGLPLPEVKTASERSLANKIRNELGLPPVPRSPSLKQKYKRAQAAGIITPLEGKTPAQKEKILKKLQDAGIPLPEGRTASEKSIIKKLEEATKVTPADKLKAAKAVGLLTPLQGKTPAQKEKILKGLAKAGLPLPEGKTPSEKSLINKIRNDMGLPPEPRSPSIKEKMRKAQEAGIITPLEGKSAAQKEKILKDLANAGIPLPEGRTPSEKALVNKVKGMMTPSKVTPERLRKAKAAGLLTPLDGKKPADKEKIVRGLADLGLPLPEGKTASEKSMIHKIRTEKGIPPPATTPSEKEVVRKAKAEGLLTPLTGKSNKEKERILKGLADAGLPLPIGSTASEKALVKKVRADAGLPLEPTPSEKRGKIKTKAKKIGVGEMKMSKAKAGLGAAEFEDIVKTTKCDRGCGCDKKKIRFKHSYVKIRVTSPDFSSICPCPNECLPGIKGGVITDNEGIKVTVGSAIGVPSYSKDLMVNRIPNSKSNSFSSIAVYTDDSNVTDTIELYPRNTRHKNIFSIPRDNFSKSDKIYELPYKIISDEMIIDSYDVYTTASNERTCDSGTWALNTTSVESRACISTPVSITLISTSSMCDTSCTESNIISSRTDSSLCLSASFSITDVSQISLASTTMDTPFSISYYCHSKLSGVCSRTSDPELTNSSYSNVINKLTYMRINRKQYDVNKTHNEFLIFRVAQSKHNYEEEMMFSKKRDPLVIIDNLDNNQNDVVKIVKELIAKNELSDTSLFLIIPTSNENSETDSSEFSSTICIQDSENYLTSLRTGLNASRFKEWSSEDPKETQLLYERPKNDRYFMEMSTSTVNGAQSKFDNDSSSHNSEGDVTNQQELTPDYKTSGYLSKSQSIRKKKTKNYFRQLLKKKRENNIAINTSTSESSVGGPPKKNFMRIWTKRSHRKDTTLIKEVNANKSYVLQNHVQLQTLYKSEKRKSHKRCQVSKVKGEKRIAGRKSSSECEDSSLERAHSELRRLDQSFCPVHGTNRRYKPEIKTKSRGMEVTTHRPCPVHGHGARHQPIMKDDTSASSGIAPNSFSSEIVVGMSFTEDDSYYVNRGTRTGEHCPCPYPNAGVHASTPREKPLEEPAKNETIEKIDKSSTRKAKLTQKEFNNILEKVDKSTPRTAKLAPKELIDISDRVDKNSTKTTKLTQKELFDIPEIVDKSSTRTAKLTPKQLIDISERVDKNSIRTTKVSPEELIDIPENINENETKYVDVTQNQSKETQTICSQGTGEEPCSAQCKCWKPTARIQCTDRDLNDTGFYDANTATEVLMMGKYHELELLYIRDVMKMFSECSQTVSGFRIDVQKKPSEPESSFAEIMKFYKKHAKKHKAPTCPRLNLENISCRCSSCATVDDGFKGLKLALGAKGQSSKGVRNNLHAESIGWLVREYEQINYVNPEFNSNQNLKSACIRYEKDRSALHEPNFLVSRMSRTKLNKYGKSKNDPILVINNLNNRRNITSVIDDILTKRQFSGSSIFIVVPSSDDIDTELSSHNLLSDIGVPSSKHALDLINITCKNINKVDLSVACGDGEPLQTINGASHRTCDNQTEFLDTVKVPTKNKRCQVYAFKDIARACYQMGTDTTQDRPCVCSPRRPIGSDKEYDTNTVLETLTPLDDQQGVTQGLACNDRELATCEKKFSVQPASAISHPSFHSVSVCTLPPCLLSRGCTPAPVPPPPMQPPSATPPQPQRPQLAPANHACICNAHSPRGQENLQRPVGKDICNHNPNYKGQKNSDGYLNSRIQQNAGAQVISEDPASCVCQRNAAGRPKSGSQTNAKGLPNSEKQTNSDGQPKFGGRSNSGDPASCACQQVAGGRPNSGSQTNSGGQSNSVRTPNYGDQPNFGCSPNCKGRPNSGGQPYPGRHLDPTSPPNSGGQPNLERHPDPGCTPNCRGQAKSGGDPNSRRHPDPGGPPKHAGQPSPKGHAGSGCFPNCRGRAKGGGPNPGRHAAPESPPKSGAQPDTCCSPNCKGKAKSGRQQKSGSPPKGAPQPNSGCSPNCRGHQKCPKRCSTIQAGTSTEKLCDNVGNCPSHIQIRKMRSDMTQTSSMLKFSIKKKSSAQCQVAMKRRAANVGIQPSTCLSVDASNHFPSPPPTTPPTIADRRFSGLKFSLNAKQCAFPTPAQL